MKIIFREKTSGLNKNTPPPQCQQMIASEKEFLDIMPNIKFRSVKDKFQKKLKEDIPKIKNLPNIFVFGLCEQSK